MSRIRTPQSKEPSKQEVPFRKNVLNFTLERFPSFSLQRRDRQRQTTTRRILERYAGQSEKSVRDIPEFLALV